MNTELKTNTEDSGWNHEDVVVDYDALIDAIEKDIANTRAELHRLSGKEDFDILFM